MRAPASFVLGITLALAGPLRGEDREGIAYFEQHVRPVLVEHCYRCHSHKAEKLKGNLYLDSKQGWELGGNSGLPAIIPGDPENSLLIRTVRHLEEDLEMPPSKPKLPDAAIAHLVAWVQRGAPDPRTATEIVAGRADKSWWSLQPLAREFAHDTIDGFIVAGLEKQGLTLNPPAGPRELIRRMSYDLTGLPPSPEEVEAFAAEHLRDSDAAARGLVDRLLASPRYGERWGRHWLDVVRFGESNGFERNFIIDTLWPFRDYVIRSFNEDKPFDRFIVEHLAGDAVGRDDPDVEVGTAFLVAGPYDDVKNLDVVAQANIQAASLDDMVTATGSAFLGLTVHCARCHDHKFDPIPTEDYYRMRAAFDGVRHGTRELASYEQRLAREAAVAPLAAEKSALERELRTLHARLDEAAAAELDRRSFPRPRVDPKLTEEIFPATRAQYVRFTINAHGGDPRSGGTRVSARSGGRSARVTEFEVWTAGPEPRNVALARNGGKAEGARAAVAEDFLEAYGPQFTIDGGHGEEWIVGSPPVLTVALAQPEEIERVTFSSAATESGRNVPCEYTVEVSLDGELWRTVATGDDREPWSREYGIARLVRIGAASADLAEVRRLEEGIARLERGIAALPALPEVWAGQLAQPEEPTFVHRGGDPMKRGDLVKPASLAVLDRVAYRYELSAEAPEQERRLALARWIAGPDNPLTLRVLANRIWHYRFGTGLVDTPSDFGFLGSKPTHPQLLDFLARRLQAHGWRLKPLHREMLLSRTYRQSSVWRAEAAAKDGDTRMLWRFPPRGLEAEEIRDTILTLAGAMQLEPMGGPGFRLYKFTQNNVSTYFPLDRHGPETYRRSVYHQSARASVVDLLTDFDFPDVAFPTPARSRTTSPLQSLTLLNHTFTLDMAEALARRITAEGAGDPVARAFALAYQRAPAPAEREAVSGVIAKHGLPAFCRALLNSNELLHVH